MPRVHHVKKARKDNPVCKRGESYYWWKFRQGGKRYSITPPKRSQLTTSGHLAAIYDAEDAVTNLYIDTSEDSLAGSMETAKDAIDAAADTFREEAESYEESASNMEEYFSGSYKVDEIREKGEACETAADECTNVVDSLQDCIDRLDEHGSKPDDFDEDEPEEGEYEEAEDFEVDYAAWETNRDAAQDLADEWVSEFDDIANDAQSAFDEFEGPQF